jgi:outer membrane protein insertion porin family
LQWTPPYSLLSPKKDIPDESDQAKYKFIEYHKWKFDASYYLGIGPKKKIVFMAAANYGLIGYYNSQIGLSPFERFYVGGDGLQGYSIDGRELIRLRGYSNYQALTPNVTDGQVENGATIFDRYTFEMRFPFTTSQAATIYGLAFAEAGNAFLRFKSFDPFDIKRSAGLGIRLYLPMFGLLGVDWGYGFDSALPGGHSGSNFHLYIGQSLF